MRRLIILPALILIPLAAPAQDVSPRAGTISRLAGRQEQAVRDLQNLLQDIHVLIDDLRSRGENDKADLLQQAVAIVTSEQISVAYVKEGDGTSRKLLGDLERAMNEMTRILKERPEATQEVQVLGQQVVDTLEQVVGVLTGQDELKSLEAREAALNEARATAQELAEKQRELREQTRNTAGRTPAEEAAARAAQALDKLAKELAELDRQARDELQELDAAREHAARLEDLLNRQQRLRQETAIRSGKADRLTPELNRAIAELEAI